MFFFILHKLCLIKKNPLYSKKFNMIYLKRYLLNYEFSSNAIYNYYIFKHDVGNKLIPIHML